MQADLFFGGGTALICNCLRFGKAMGPEVLGAYYFGLISVRGGSQSYDGFYIDSLASIHVCSRSRELSGSRT